MGDELKQLKEELGDYLVDGEYKTSDFMDFLERAYSIGYNSGKLDGFAEADEFKIVKPV